MKTWGSLLEYRQESECFVNWNILVIPGNLELLGLATTMLATKAIGQFHLESVLRRSQDTNSLPSISDYGQVAGGEIVWVGH